MARTGLRGVRVAEGSSLGRLVAGTVSTAWFAGCVLAVAGLLGVAGVLSGDLALAGWLALSAGAGLVAAEALYRRARARLGGVTGDVMGAMGETATAAVLLVAAAVV